MSPKLEPEIWSRDTGHIGIHGGVDVRTVVRSPKPNSFLAQMGYHIFFPMELPYNYKSNFNDRENERDDDDE